MKRYMIDFRIERSERPFDFRRGLSIDNALCKLHERFVKASDTRLWAVVVGLDIRNIFKSLG